MLGALDRPLVTYRPRFLLDEEALGDPTGVGLRGGGEAFRTLRDALPEAVPPSEVSPPAAAPAVPPPAAAEPGAAERVRSDSSPSQALPALDLSRYVGALPEKPTYDARKADRARTAQLVASLVGGGVSLLAGPESGVGNAVASVARGVAGGAGDVVERLDDSYTESMEAYTTALTRLMQEEAQNQRYVYGQEQQGARQQEQLEASEARTAAQIEASDRRHAETQARLAEQFEGTQGRLLERDSYERERDRVEDARRTEDLRYERGQDTRRDTREREAFRLRYNEQEREDYKAVTDLREEMEAYDPGTPERRQAAERYNAAARRYRTAYGQPGSRQGASGGSSSNLEGWAQNRGLTVTSSTGGRHVPGSSHPEGRAIDVRTRDMSEGQVQDTIRAAEAAGYRVLDERTDPGHGYWTGPHLHIEAPQGTAPASQPGRGAGRSGASRSTTAPHADPNEALEFGAAQLERRFRTDAGEVDLDGIADFLDAAVAAGDMADAEADALGDYLADRYGL